MSKKEALSPVKLDFCNLLVPRSDRELLLLKLAGDLITLEKVLLGASEFLLTFL